MNAIDHPAVREALSALERLSADELHQSRAEARDEALLEQVRRVEAGKVGSGVEMAIGLLTCLLDARFGPLSAITAERIRAGTAADLDRWCERLITADSLDAVFGGTPGSLGVH